MTCKSVQLISSMVLGVTHKTTKQEADTTQNTKKYKKNRVKNYLKYFIP